MYCFFKENDYIRPALYMKLIVNNMKYRGIYLDKQAAVRFLNSYLPAKCGPPGIYLYIMHLLCLGCKKAGFLLKNQCNQPKNHFFKMKLQNALWEKLSHIETKKLNNYIIYNSELQQFIFNGI